MGTVKDLRRKSYINSDILACHKLKKIFMH